MVLSTPFFNFLNRCLAPWLCAAASLLWPAANAAEPLFKMPHVNAELVAARTAIRAGETLTIALRLQHQPQWHTYWRNPGDSGLPTAVDWQIPAGAKMGAIEWPAPKRLPVGPLVNYGYEGELLLPVQFSAPAKVAAGSTLTLRAQARWLVCKDICVPESAALTLQLPVVDATTEPGATAQWPALERIAAQQPQPLDASAWAAELQHAGRQLLLTLTRKASAGAASAAVAATPLVPPSLEVFPYDERVIEPARHEVFRTPQGYAIRLALADAAAPPPVFSGVAVAAGVASPWGAGKPLAAEFNATVRSVASIVLPPGAVAMTLPVDANKASPEAVASSGVLAALTLAVVGGLVLNLMPCVFPVLSIKLLSLAQHDLAPAVRRQHALLYSAGVVLTFLALAGVLLVLQAGGRALGWGFQLQEPGVVFVLALLFFAMALNLAGAFEFGLAGLQPLLALRLRHPGIDALASGVLAVVAASPCTAPFMGAAIGFAVTQPAAVALSVFAALGLGMALPYTALVLLPGWRDHLPRPGPWMLRLKQLLAFPLFATVVWLLWVLGLQAGLEGVVKALLAFIALAFVSWAAPLLPAPGWLARAGAVAALLAVGMWSWPVALPATHTQAAPAPLGQPSAASWQPYDDIALARYLAAGQPVFIDFTAAWCVSCQVNKRLVLQRTDTLAAFAQAKVVLMRADWTQQDARITAALLRLGRNGVPVYALMRPGREPLLLPEVLTLARVRNALAAP